MKKLMLAFGLMAISVASYAQSCSEPVFCSNTASCFLPKTVPALGFSFYFQPTFIRTTLFPVNDMPFFATTNTVYPGFQAMQYKFPEGAVFCRMENTICKRYGFMFSIHAGGYSER